jgi:multiple sugar transport system substrate-binding protein
VSIESKTFRGGSKLNKSSNLLLALMITLSLVVAGCGNSGNSSNSGIASSSAENGTETAGSAESPAAKQEPVTLKYTFWGGPGEKKTQLDAINGFMKKYPWIKVNTQHIPEDYSTKITTMAAANQLPDLGLLQGGITLQWAQEGRILNLYPYFQNDPEISLEDVLDTTKYWWEEEKLAGVNGALEAFAIFYNKDIFNDLGVPLPPTSAADAYTWEEFVNTAQLLTIDRQGRNALDPNFDPKNIKQFGVTLPTWAYMNAVHANGGQMVNEDGTQFLLNSPEAAQAIQNWADLVHKYHVAPNAAQSKNIPGGATGLQSKQVAMKIDGQWGLVDLGISKMNFGIAALPTMSQYATMTVGDPIVIFEGTKHPDEAWLLLKWMMNPENTLELQSSGLWMPVLKKWYEDPELVAKWAEGNPAHPEGYVDAVLKPAFEHGYVDPMYYVKNLPEISAIVNPALDKVWTGEVTAQKALDDIKTKVEAKLKGVFVKQ